MINLVLLTMLGGLGAAYALRVLIFELSAPGPFEASTAFVADFSTGGAPARMVNLFDRVRRLFGVYRVVVDEKSGLRLWNVWEPRAQVWRCPKCLSFYVSIPFTLCVLIAMPGQGFSLRLGEYLALLPLVHGAIVFIAQFLVFLQILIEENTD